VLNFFYTYFKKKKNVQFWRTTTQTVFKKSIIYKGLGYKLYKSSNIIIVKASYNTVLHIIIPYLTFCKIKKKRWNVNFHAFSKNSLMTFVKDIVSIYPINDYKFLGFKLRTKKKFKIGKKARY